ncbi:hypothetical protein [Nonomuraea sp. NPDC049480]|uniref:hypothetical protein n=1 Tax=Nonomuraea sp. NPDC049480 TaxID=3364353 RepID=UPI0037AA5125
MHETAILFLEFGAVLLGLGLLGALALRAGISPIPLYLPVLTTMLAGLSLVSGAISVGIALATERGAGRGAAVRAVHRGVRLQPELRGAAAQGGRASIPTWGRRRPRTSSSWRRSAP